MKASLFLIFLLYFFELSSSAISLLSEPPLIQNANDLCQKIKCGKTSSTDICIEVDPTSSTSTFQECPENKQCSTPSEDPIEEAKCITPPSSTQKYFPSLPCSGASSCYSGVCENGICIGKKEGETCSNPNQCEYGFTCRKDQTIPDETIYKCLKPLNVGETCLRDTDCSLNSGCLSGKCTFYFSIDNGQLSRENDQNNGGLTFCKSGFSNEFGICTNFSLTNEITECNNNNNNPCTYTDLDSGDKLIIPENCLCGYNPFGNQYCLLGPGNKNYTKYLQKLKDYRLNNNENCHLAERAAEGCQKDLIGKDSKNLLQIHELINSKYWALSNNRLIDAPECVFPIELPDYDRSLDKDEAPVKEGKCAVYSCKTKIKNGALCAKSTYENIFSIKVELSDICPEDVTCKIGGDPNDIFYNETDTESRCISEKIENKKYPGEKCEVDTECFYPPQNPSSQFHKCVEGRCNGMDENGICEDNSWCISGYFCSPLSGRCIEQKKSGEECFNSKECQNNLLCIDSKCSSELFSLDDGKNVPSYENDPEVQKMFCKNINVKDGKCVSYSDINKKMDNENEYKECQFGTKCKYKINGIEKEEIFEVMCPCGFNEEGKGYCPHYQDYFTDDRETYREKLKISFDNECHTENRYNCYQYEEIEKIKELRNKLERGHLFYKSVECANKVLGSKYIEVKKILFVMILNALGLLLL